MNDLFEVKFVSEEIGRGLFAKKFIRKGTIVDVAHVILIPNDDYDVIQDTMLYDYTYLWEDPQYSDTGEYQCAIALSICQFMNHSYDPNVKYTYNYDDMSINFIAIKDIKKGEQLTVNYNGEVDDKSPVWFEPSEL